jgi:hypothetical protein
VGVRASRQNLFAAALTPAEVRSVVDGLEKVRARGFNLPETDFKLRRSRLHAVWSE